MLGSLDRLLRGGEPVGGLPGVAEACGQFTEEHHVNPISHRAAEFIKTGAQQLQSGTDIAAPDDEHPPKGAAQGAPGRQCPRAYFPFLQGMHGIARSDLRDPPELNDSSGTDRH